MGGTGDDGYILARTEAEVARLRTQARAWEALTLRVLTGAGIAPGMRCLDAGCGPGEAMRLIGRAVGTGGHVTGIDLDAELGARMLAELHREEGPQFDFVAGDLTREGAIPGAPFDIVFTRLLLLHLADPVAAVRALAAQARPGGRLVLMDFDVTRLACIPAAPAMTRAYEVIVACHGRDGRHADCGLRLAGYLAAAGLPPPEGSDVGAFYQPIADRGPMLRAVLASLAPAAAALGVATAGEMADLQAEIRALEAGNRHHTLGPLMVGVWTTVSRAS